MHYSFYCIIYASVIGVVSQIWRRYCMICIYIVLTMHPKLTINSGTDDGPSHGYSHIVLAQLIPNL